jgi:hypothetical protein
LFFLIFQESCVYGFNLFGHVQRTLTQTYILILSLPLELIQHRFLIHSEFEIILRSSKTLKQLPLTLTLFDRFLNLSVWLVFL